jgi:antitoxin component YwqK of YwqJK toxin-antitoxin module
MSLFYYLPEYKEPNVYAQHVAWYNARKKELQVGGQIDKETHRLLHGPYQRFVNGKLVEEGYYNQGVKHGRWEAYDGNYMLLDKVRYYKGWPSEAEITYYDADRKKIKEVVPVQYGVKHGEYYQFYEGGQLAVKGQYDNGQPVGKWMEYYQFRRRYKKETQYPKDPYDRTTQPYTLREWDDKGNLTFDKEKEDKKPSAAFRETDETEPQRAQRRRKDRKEYAYFFAPFASLLRSLRFSSFLCVLCVKLLTATYQKASWMCSRCRSPSREMAITSNRTSCTQSVA